MPVGARGEGACLVRSEYLGWQRAARVGRWLSRVIAGQGDG